MVRNHSGEDTFRVKQSGPPCGPVRAGRCGAVRSGNGIGNLAWIGNHPARRAVLGGMTDLQPASGTPRPSPRGRAAATALLLTLVAAACSPAAAPSATPGSTGSPTAGPTTSPSPSPTAAAGGLQHPTGATDIVLRIDESGGFIPLEANATSAPWFTLYGDGTIVFRDPYASAPEPVGNVSRAVPFLTVKLDEGGIQALLQQALNEGGLAVATGPYQGMAAGGDLPTTTFTLNLDGRSKDVAVTALSPEMHPQDALIVGQISRFAEKLRGFGNDIGGEQPYVAPGFRGILIPVEQPFGPVVAWPWPDLSPDDFKSGANEFFLTRTMTADEVATLGIPDVGGGLLGVALQKDGKIYTFSLRPLLPDETS